MADFFGLEEPQQVPGVRYVSSSKPAITNMAKMLAAHPEKFNIEDPEVGGGGGGGGGGGQCDEFMFAMEEDPEMYAAPSLAFHMN
jgi:hypothetical protein